MNADVIVPPPADTVAGAALDDPERRSQLDPQGALTDVEHAAQQWKVARDVPVPDVAVACHRQVVVVGLGGSGLIGDVVAEVARHRCPLPVLVSREATLPAYVGPGSLVIACSHSGGTREVVAAAQDAIRRDATLVAIAGGGPLAELAAARGVWVPVPTDCPPRHSLGAMLVPMLRLVGCGEGLDEAVDTVAEVTAACGSDVPYLHNTAKLLGAALADGSVPMVFGGVGAARVVAQRLRTQLNENAKLPALSANLPELAHNEIVAWERPGPLDGRARLLWLRDPLAETRADRVAYSHVAALVAARRIPVHEIRASGEQLLARVASLLVGCDLISVYAALARGVDPTPITSIAHLKAASAV